MQSCSCSEDVPPVEWQPAILHTRGNMNIYCSTRDRTLDSITDQVFTAIILKVFHCNLSFPCWPLKKFSCSCGDGLACRGDVGGDLAHEDDKEADIQQLLQQPCLGPVAAAQAVTGSSPKEASSQPSLAPPSSSTPPSSKSVDRETKHEKQN